MRVVLAEVPHVESMTVVPAKVPSKVRGPFLIMPVAPATVHIKERVSVLTMTVVPAQIPSVKRGTVPIMVDLQAP